ncbi:DNA (cytosine-5-)-methyltransferase [Glaesserella parasuis]|nr:DNA (cytosine-5-)-methyltransferase [Glaesserella parasuis]AIK16710.1 XRE family transcriptional regulator [Glaesserella parasuis]KDB46264.1 XRE family transcriptional regulator [Glaesserella parasuis HPS9]MCT8534532.1 DNA (cytosine-5-)-methyltransferase [Glaesserella parasuis]MCT8547318.1 DNA (cytosine-5-)-methyltransferase [Glaesserella parasuis]MCT8551242.1 DNA (cytosine-5-)-methyltransferase [Glaesserella parasuis]
MSYLTFMDFCSGIGGGRLGLELNGMQCVGHSEIDPEPDTTYQIFFNDRNNLGDLTQIDIQKLPDFDVMLAGFPCQTFSIAGKREGFEDDRGQIIYHLADILTWKKVPYFILENVKGLVNHNKGQTLKSIIQLLEQCGYDVYYQVLDSQFYGVPQMRERIYFVGIRKDIKHKPFEFPTPEPIKDIAECLIEERDYIFDENNPTFQKYLHNKYNNNKVELNNILQKDYQVIDWRQSDFRCYEKKSPTLRTGRHGILYTKDGKLRKLSGYEALLLQGFPKHIASKVVEYNIPENKILSQAGNAMTVTVIQKIAEQLLKVIEK